MAVYMAALQPGDAILSLELSHGGHLTHGLKVNFSGRLYGIVHYGVSRETNVVDYDEVLRLAKEHRPKLIVCGGSPPPPPVRVGTVPPLLVVVPTLAPLLLWPVLRLRR